MSERFLCVVGDPTTGGGQALTGAAGFDLECLDGVLRPVVRVGDPVLCGQCGPTQVVSGVEAFWVSGPLVAADGSELACGHKLVAKLQRGFSVTDGTSARRGDSRRLAPAYVAPSSGVRYSAQFVVRNAKGRPVADFPYLIVDGAGKEYRGRTNTAGETARRYSSVYTRFELYPDETVEQGGNGLEVCKEC